MVRKCSGGYNMTKLLNHSCQQYDYRGGKNYNRLRDFY